MRHWVSGLCWFLSGALAVTAAFAPVSPLRAQAVATAQQVTADSIPPAISSLIIKGQTLENSGRWAEALSYYEEVLHEHPEDPFLTDRFEVARLHYSIDQRYGDHSFRNSIKSLSRQQALALYGDLLSKIDTHYYTTPPWQQLIRRGGQSLDFALTDEAFLKVNGITAARPQIDQARAEIAQLAGRYAIRSSSDALNVAAQIANVANARIGLSPSAAILEFTAAAAGSLDHYSGYLTPDQLRDMYSQIEGNFVGLGVELKADDGTLLIVDVIKNSPAQKAGILAGDRIVAVDGHNTQDMSTDEAASMLTGVEGSTVRVTVATPNQVPRVLTIRRASVEVPSLEDVKIIKPAEGIAYLKIPAFQKSTAQDLEAALWDLHRQGMRSLIIDLRGNPGGLLTASVEVADKFIAGGGIVETRGRSEQENFNYRAHRPGTWRVPLAVMIDGDSASASEIFAGAIKDSGRGVLVGSRSYGKGSVQGIFPLGTSGAGVRLTTARFFSPLGHPISNVGVLPDIDARRATLVAGEEQKAHTVGFRGPNLAGAENGSIDVGPSMVDAAAAAKQANNDPALDAAVDAVRKQPVAQL